MVVSSELAFQFLKFFIGGVLTASIDIFLTWFLLSSGVDPYISVSAGFTAALIFNYTFNAVFTFRVTMNTSSMFKYGILVGLNYIMTLMIVFAVIKLFGWSALGGKVISIGIIMFTNYFLSKYWIYKIPDPNVAIREY